ncbi:uncharacterized protein LOC135078363 [Ostrinia nubilalis]|uniref:uncharacterized protein LOC135078363 n=1 Tax=Ostrinia nubilalis TaxID=29057 RepID=UPI0030822DC1
MVLLSPSIGGLRKLLAVCERFASTHGMKYNVKKSELMIFRAGKGPERVPPVYLNGSPVQVVKQFRYLGHVLTEHLDDDADMERERRALAVRCNMLARRFAKCSRDVKVTLFKAFCTCFYTCQLWRKYKRKSYGTLRVQYNNAFRIMMRLPRCCSASAMFAEAGVPDFFALLRERIASFWQRIRDSPNELLTVVSNDLYKSPFLSHWLDVHRSANRK